MFKFHDCVFASAAQLQGIIGICAWSARALLGRSGVVITVTEALVVQVVNTDGTTPSGLPVYAFDGTTYTGYNGVTSETGNVTFTLPQGNYRFRADESRIQF